MFVFGAGDTLIERQTGVHVGNKVIRQQRRHAQLHFRLLAGEIFQRRLATLFQGIDGVLQQFHIQREADSFHLSALTFSQQFAGAANFKIVGC